MFSGSFVALVTPFDEQGGVDETKLAELVEFHIEKGTDGIVPCGTTGESPTLNYEEHNRVVELVVKAASGRVPVIAGAGSNSTSETIMLAEHAKQVGADAALVITPYYNKPSQEGLYQHYLKVCQSVDIPVIIYNVPGRTGVCIEPETVIRLAKAHKNIVGVKFASTNLDQISQIMSQTDLCILSGDDSLTVPMVSLGAKGVISVAANIVPEKMAMLVKAALNGENEKARKLHYEVFALCRGMFLETNPIPVKSAMAMMGMITPGFRLPLCDMSEANSAELKKILGDCGLL